jgi:hypothetical protein
MGSINTYVRAKSELDPGLNIFRSIIKEVDNLKITTAVQVFDTGSFDAFNIGNDISTVEMLYLFNQDASDYLIISADDGVGNDMKIMPEESIFFKPSPNATIVAKANSGSVTVNIIAAGT